MDLRRRDAGKTLRAVRLKIGDALGEHTQERLTGIWLWHVERGTPDTAPTRPITEHTVRTIERGSGGRWFYLPYTHVLEQVIHAAQKRHVGHQPLEEVQAEALQQARETLLATRPTCERIGAKAYEAPPPSASPLRARSLRHLSKLVSERNEGRALDELFIERQVLREGSGERQRWAQVVDALEVGGLCLLVGEAGLGKTTLLAHTVSATPHALYAAARDFADKLDLGLRVVEAAAMAAAQGLAGDEADAAQALIEAGGALLAIDGVDEVRRFESRVRLLRAAEVLAETTGCRVILASRPSELSLPEGLEPRHHWRLARLEPDEAAGLLRLWFDDAAEEPILELLSREDAAAWLLSNPWHLSIAGRLGAQWTMASGGVGTQATLLRALVAHHLDRFVRRAGLPPIRRAALVTRARALAWGLWSAEDEGGSVLSHLEGAWAEELVSAGLLIDVGEDWRPHYAFLHPSVLEFLAAGQCIAEGLDAEGLQTLLEDERGRALLPLAVAQDEALLERVVAGAAEGMRQSSLKDWSGLTSCVVECLATAGPEHLSAAGLERLDSVVVGGLYRLYTQARRRCWRELPGREILKRFTALRSRPSADRLVSYFQEHDWNPALGALEPGRLREWIRAALLAPDPVRRWLALWSVGAAWVRGRVKRDALREIAPDLEAIARDQGLRFHLRALALRLLCDLGGESAFEVAGGLMRGDPDSALRGAAANALAQLRGPDPLPSLIARAQELSEEIEDPTNREIIALVGALELHATRWSSSEARAALLKIFSAATRSSHGRIRSSGASGLGWLPAPERWTALRALLDDEERTPRRSAMFACGTLVAPGRRARMPGRKYRARPVPRGIGGERLAEARRFFVDVLQNPERGPRLKTYAMEGLALLAEVRRHDHEDCTRAAIRGVVDTPRVARPAARLLCFASAFRFEAAVEVIEALAGPRAQRFQQILGWWRAPRSGRPVGGEAAAWLLAQVLLETRDVSSALKAIDTLEAWAFGWGRSTPLSPRLPTMRLVAEALNRCTNAPDDELVRAARRAASALSKRATPLLDAGLQAALDQAAGRLP